MGVLWVVEGLDYVSEGVEDINIHIATQEDMFDPLHMVIYFNSIPLVEGCQPDNMIQEYKNVQSLFRSKKRIGKRVFHEIFYADAYGVKLWRANRKFWFRFADKCGRYYYDMGFQIVYAAHWSPKRGYHIHFVGNAVSYLDGRKWRTKDADIVSRGALFNGFFNECGRIRREEEKGNNGRIILY